jgi:hypothetical protein
MEFKVNPILTAHQYCVDGYKQGTKRKNVHAYIYQDMTADSSFYSII